MCVFNIWCLAACLLLLSMPTKAQNGALPWGTGTPPAWATTKEGIMSKMMGSDTTSFWTVKAAAEAYLVAHPEEVGDDEQDKRAARLEAEAQAEGGRAGGRSRGPGGAGGAGGAGGGQRRRTTGAGGPGGGSRGPGGGRR